MAIHLKKCSWSNCVFGEKISCLKSFSFFLMHFCQAAIFFFEIWLDFSKLRKLWYQLRFEAEFMQFRNCEIKTDQSNQFSGQDSKEAIWTFSLFLWCICWLSYNTYTTPAHSPFNKNVLCSISTRPLVFFELHSRSDCMKEFSGFASRESS